MSDEIGKPFSPERSAAHLAKFESDHADKKAITARAGSHEEIHQVVAEWTKTEGQPPCATNIWSDVDGLKFASAFYIKAAS